METKTMKVLLTEDDVIMFEDHEKHAFGISSSKEELTPGGKIVFSTDKKSRGWKMGKFVDSCWELVSC